MITIISPAKKLKEIGFPKQSKKTMPPFIKEAEELIMELRKYSPSELQTLMNISNNIAEMNYERFLRWTADSTSEKAGPAIFMFNGQVYNGLDPDTLEQQSLEFGQNHLRILSGLYGILRPFDHIQPYRLEMGTKLQNEHGNSLYKFWGKKINQKINKELQQASDQVLINLASQEYFKAIQPKSIDGTIITPLFKEKKGDDYKTIAVYAKTARGLMTRFILEQETNDPEVIKTFDKKGYLYNPDLSTENEWVFTR